MAPRDRAFVRRLAATTLRRFGQAEALVQQRLDRGPLPARQTVLRILLAQSAAELVYLATPAHAVIDTAVRIARSDPALSGHAGLINAVLRRIAREVPDEASAEAAAAPLLNLPLWLRQRWVQNFGAHRAGAIAAAIGTEPTLDISVKSDRAIWAERLEAQLLPTGTLRRPVGGRVGALPGYDDGAWWVQDAAAALPARLLGEVRGRDVADLCAAPGGKTAQLIAAGAHVTALDHDPGRLSRLELNLKRLGFAARLDCADLTSWKPPQSFSHVLLDAPCLATGTLRRHPDLIWGKRESDIAPMTAQQSALLDAAFLLLPPSGTLVYAVCSLEPEEGEQQIAAFLQRQPDGRLDPIQADEFPGIAQFVTPQGMVQTTPEAWPEFGGLDGFFAARIRRVR